LGETLLTGAVRDDGAARVRTGRGSRRAFRRRERRAAWVYKPRREMTRGDPWDRKQENDPSLTTDTRDMPKMQTATVLAQRDADTWQCGPAKHSRQRRRGARRTVAGGTEYCGDVARPDPLPAPAHHPKSLGHRLAEAQGSVHADDGGVSMKFPPPR